MTPTAIMKVPGLTGRSRTARGARYVFQSTSRFVNLSRPATIGTMPNTSRIAQYADSVRLSCIAISFRSLRVGLLDAAAATRVTSARPRNLGTRRGIQPVRSRHDPVPRDLEDDGVARRPRGGPPRARGRDAPLRGADAPARPARLPHGPRHP